MDVAGWELKFPFPNKCIAEIYKSTPLEGGQYVRFGRDSQLTATREALEWIKARKEEGNVLD